MPQSKKIEESIIQKIEEIARGDEIIQTTATASNKVITKNKKTIKKEEYKEIECEHCKAKIKIPNEVDISKKGVKCKWFSCCSFKISKKDKHVEMKKTKEGESTGVADKHDYEVRWGGNEN